MEANLLSVPGLKRRKRSFPPSFTGPVNDPPLRRARTTADEALLDELLLEEASRAPPRLTVGCATEAAVTSPPAPRLVGIELNPGPGGRSMSKRSQALVVVAPTPIVTQPRRRQPRRRKRGGRRGGLPSSAADTALFEYVNSLNNPFEHAGLRLGYDCFVPTTLSTAYLRTSYTVNADGSFAFATMPGAVGGNFLMKTLAGASTATWNAESAANVNAFTNNYAAARPISVGIRLFCLFAETSAPGVLVSGALPSKSITQIAAYAPSDLFAAPTSELGIGTRGAAAVGRPQDPYSFMFQNSCVTATGPAASTLSQLSVPYIAGRGFPTGTVVWIEVVHNYECLILDSASGMDSGGDDTLNTAADFFPTVENLFSSARRWLTSPSVMDAAQVVMDVAHPLAGRTLRASRQAFGQSGAGARQARNGASNSVIIEEMQEDAGVLVAARRR